MNFLPPVRLGTVVSTQDVIREMAGQGAPAGTVVVADRQTGGRGRQGRPWVTLHGSQLYASVLLRPDLPRADLPILAIAAGLAVAEAIEAAGLPDVGLKWPNDLFLGGKKVGGVLAEAFSAPAGGSFVALGVGVNLSGSEEDLPPEIRGIATTLAEHLSTGNPPAPLLLLKSILGSFGPLYSEAVEGRRDSLAKGFSRRWVYRGRPIEVRTGDGTIRGTAEGIDADGALLLTDERGETIRIVSGEIAPL